MRVILWIYCIIGGSANNVPFSSSHVNCTLSGIQPEFPSLETPLVLNRRCWARVNFTVSSGNGCKLSTACWFPYLPLCVLKGYLRHWMNTSSTSLAPLEDSLSFDAVTAEKVYVPSFAVKHFLRKCDFFSQIKTN